MNLPVLAKEDRARENRLQELLQLIEGDIVVPEDPEKTGPDRKLIGLKEEHENRSWTESLKGSEFELRKAVSAVGTSAEAIREYLGQRRYRDVSFNADFDDTVARLGASIHREERKPTKRAPKKGIGPCRWSKGS